MQTPAPLHNFFAARKVACGLANPEASDCRRLGIERRRSDCAWRGTVWVRAVLYNEIMLLRPEATVIEHLILGVFLVVPLLIVAFLFSDELWQEHRLLHDMRPAQLKPRRIDWRHPLRRSRHRL
ncbi:hypothetical protein [Paraburkholderia aromaticivorans]|uniref:hypothetical protein n=1 Tax=Paraburkholderia aromaticivorans TaxID=2026199 RepID=UPI001FC9FC63|nr:hypothetical protein [Paraburkholderia aromaticivorans]